MPPDVIGIVFAAGWPPVFAAGCRWRGGRRLSFWVPWLVAAVCTLLTQALARDYPAAAIAAGHAVIAAAGWWLSRRRKRRAPKLAGAKSKALLAAVVAKMRESLKPRAVLRPLAGGAR